MSSDATMENKHSASFFTRFARHISVFSGRPLTFFLAVTTIVIWAVLGPLFGFSDTWQLVINTGTTIVTFLMVFLIQNTQNRDTEALQIKLDELIRSSRTARNELLDLEELEEKELEERRQEYLELAEQARSRLEKKRGKGK
jgi:low affinity Fe/Cu permease